MKRLVNRLLKYRKDRGFALLSAMVMLTAVTAFSATMINYLLSTRQAAKNFETQVYATEQAEAGLYKALHCLNAASGTNCGGAYGPSYAGETNVVFGEGKFTTTVAAVGANKVITATGITAGGKQKEIKLTVSNQPPTTDASFDYALQVGDGGVTISNNAEVRSGSIYAHSNINCGNNAKIDGPVFISIPNGLVTGCTSYGDIHADRVTSNKMNSHDVYYNTTNTGNQNVGSAYGSQPTPPAKTLPTIDLDWWHDRAAEGGIITGNYTAANGSHLGPKKITGDLLLGNNAIVTLDGPVWVQGTILFDNNAQLNLNPSFGANSTVVMADGTVNVQNNAQINGSGHLKSFILIHSSSTDTNYAIDIKNNAAGAVFYAPNGGIDISNNATVTAVAAKKVALANNCIIDYSSTYHDASDILLSASASGLWRLVPGGWRETK